MTPDFPPWLISPLPAVLNAMLLEERRHEDHILVEEQVRFFLEREACLAQTLRDAAASDDAVAVEFRAHALKQTAARLGAEDVVDAARAIELMALHGVLDRLEPALGVLDDLLEELRIALTGRHPVR